MNITRSLTGLILVFVVTAIGLPLNAAAQTAPDNFDLTAAAKAAFLKARYSEAESYYRQAVRNAEASNAPASKQAPLLGDLAQLLADTGRHKESEDLFHRALKMSESENVDPRVRTILMLNLAALYTQTKRSELAEHLLEETASLCRKYFGDQSPQMMNVLKALGVVYAQTKRLKLAEARLKEALQLAERPGIARPQDLASILTSLGSVYTLRQDWNRAEPVFLRSIEMLESSLGRNHPDIADALLNLGVQYSLRGDFVRAEGAFRRTRDIRLAAFGPDNAGVAQASSSLASALTAQKKLEEARLFFLSALPIQERLLGSNSPEFAHTLEEYSGLLRLTEDTSEAEILEARVQRIRAARAYTVSAESLGK